VAEFVLLSALPSFATHRSLDHAGG
jgi:hypothetical protein